MTIRISGWGAPFEYTPEPRLGWDWESRMSQRAAERAVARQAEAILRATEEEKRRAQWTDT